MLRWLSVTWFALLAGCGLSADLTMDAYAPASLYHAEIRECLDQHICGQLCVRVFTLGLDEIESCRIVSHDDVGANVRVKLYAGDDGYYDDNDSYDDDGSCDNDCDGYDDSYDDDYDDYDDYDEPTDDPPPDDDGSGGPGEPEDPYP